MVNTRGATWKRVSPARLLCDWHRKGRPPGATSRFFVDACPRCLEKLAAGLCELTDPTPKQLFVRFYKEKVIRRADFRGRP